MKNGIYKFIIIAENVLNFHSSERDYYEEWYEDVTDENGWTVILNMPQQTQHDFTKLKLNRYLELMELTDWRVYKPFHLFKKIDTQIGSRLQ
jgi:MFS superfamily sulfate permease-like transporter